MSDKTMEDIKSGKGLPPLSSNSDSSGQSGVVMEQRAEKGITYEIFTHHGNKKNSNSKGNS